MQTLLFSSWGLMRVYTFQGLGTLKILRDELDQGEELICQKPLEYISLCSRRTWVWSGLLSDI